MSFSSLHTTLAQDAFRLYYGVIDYVTDKLHKDLIKDGKSETEAKEIIEKLATKWKSNLHKSRCIDEGGLLGIHSDKPVTNIKQPKNKQPSLPPPIPDMMTPTPLPYVLPPQIFSNSKNNNDEPPKKRIKLDPPKIVPQIFATSNPHIQGMGVPTINQIHNPFINPENNSQNFPQNDGPLPGSTNIIAQKSKFKSNFTKSPETNTNNWEQTDGPVPMLGTSNNPIGFEESDEEEDNDIRKRTKLESHVDNNNEANEAHNVQYTPAPKPLNTSKLENDDDLSVINMKGKHDLNGPLNSEDDDEDDDVNLDPDDKIICQFLKVNRRKNEWYVELKHGLMHINGKDYAFVKAQNGKFCWD